MSKSYQPAPNVSIQQMPLHSRGPHNYPPQMQHHGPMSPYQQPQNVGHRIVGPPQPPGQYPSPQMDMQFAAQARPQMPPQYVQPNQKQPLPATGIPPQGMPASYQNQPIQPSLVQAQAGPSRAQAAPQRQGEVQPPPSLDVAINNYQSVGPIALCQLAAALVQDIMIKGKELCSQIEMVQMNAAPNKVDSYRQKHEAWVQKRSATIVQRFTILEQIQARISTFAKDLTGSEYEGFGSEFTVATEEQKDKFKNDPKIQRIMEDRTALVKERDEIREKLVESANFIRDMLKTIDTVS